MKKQLISLKFFLFRLILAASLASVTVSCAHIQTPPPAVSLVNMEVGEVSLFETSLIVTTRLTNDNNAPVIFSGLSHEITLNNKRIGKSLSREQIVIEPLDSIKVRSELELSHLNLALDIPKLMNSNNLKYLIKTRFFLDGFTGRSVETTSSGTLLDGSK